MPLYTFKCDNCSMTLDRMMSYSASNIPFGCDEIECFGKMERVISAPVFVTHVPGVSSNQIKVDYSGVMKKAAELSRK